MEVLYNPQGLHANSCEKWFSWRLHAKVSEKRLPWELCVTPEKGLARGFYDGCIRLHRDCVHPPGYTKPQGLHANPVKKGLPRVTFPVV